LKVAEHFGPERAAAQQEQAVKQAAAQARPREPLGAAQRPLTLVTEFIANIKDSLSTSLAAALCIRGPAHASGTERDAFLPRWACLMKRGKSDTVHTITNLKK
jgi:hypothetical protein